jgi:hypothetical protein
MTDEMTYLIVPAISFAGAHSVALVERIIADPESLVPGYRKDDYRTSLQRYRDYKYAIKKFPSGMSIRVEAIKYHDWKPTCVLIDHFQFNKVAELTLHNSRIKIIALIPHDCPENLISEIVVDNFESLAILLFYDNASLGTDLAEILSSRCFADVSDNQTGQHHLSRILSRIRNPRLKRMRVKLFFPIGDDGALIDNLLTTLATLIKYVVEGQKSNRMKGFLVHGSVSRE